MYRKKKTRSIIIIALVLTIILFTGCSKDSQQRGTFSDQGKGRIYGNTCSNGRAGFESIP